MTNSPSNSPSNSQPTVLVFGDRPVPRSLRSQTVARVDTPGRIDSAIGAASRVAVVGSDADLATVLTRLLRSERLDIEVAHIRPGPLAWRHARRAASATAHRVPLIRDDTGAVLVGSALWLPPAGADRLRGEAVVDDAVLFDGAVAGVRIEPTAMMPGLRARLIGGPGSRWVSGRAAQLGTTGVRVIRDGVPGQRESKRSTFYRHTTGWLRVDC